MHWGFSYLREDIQDFRQELRGQIQQVRQDLGGRIEHGDSRCQASRFPRSDRTAP